MKLNEGSVDALGVKAALRQSRREVGKDCDYCPIIAKDWIVLPIPKQTKPFAINSMIC